MTFAELHANRVRGDLVPASACAGVGLLGQPFAPLPVAAFGRGLSIRFVLAPQV